MPTIPSPASPVRCAPFQYLLWVDCTAGAVAGVAMLAFSGGLSRLYALPRPLLIGMGLVNLAFAAYSSSLAQRSHRPLALIELLVAGNATWAVLCAIAAVRMAGTASAFGLAHLAGEGAFVGALAALEWYQRLHLLRTP